jgi:uncharacterized integral membrane protein (TIGR00697 family)
VAFFIVLSQLALHFISTTPGDVLDSSMQTVFTLSLRIAFASIVAYMFAQYVNIVVYSWIKERTKDKFLWLQSNGANIIGQFVDSCLFFTIAFIDLPGNILIQAILAGWAVKVFVVLLATPALYLDRFLLRKK